MLATEAILRRKKQYIKLSVYFDNLLQSSSVPKKDLIFFTAQLASAWFVLCFEIKALLLTPFFARSFTLVPRSWLLNRTETLATQASEIKSRYAPKFF